MGQYTESRNIAAENLSIDDDDFEDKLKEIAKQFRGVDDALTEFIVEHGYRGQASDVDAKAQFLRDRFKAKGIKQPRDLKKWFVPVKKLDRDTLYQVCFAFGLTVSETEDFFRRIYCARAFDCHTVKEERLDKLLDAVEKSRSYSKQNLSEDDNHLYAKNTIAKATILTRSSRGMGKEKEIKDLLVNAKIIIEQNTLPYADVRLNYYLAWGWYYALIQNDADATEMCITDARNLAEKIISTDLNKIETIIIPCANMYYELKSYNSALKLLFDGIRLCTAHANTDTYARKKQELCSHFWDVGIEAKAFASCQYFIKLMDIENESIVKQQNKVFIPDSVRKIVAEKSE